MQQGPVVQKKTCICVKCGICTGSRSTFITWKCIKTHDSCSASECLGDNWTERTRASNHTNLTLFSNFHPCALWRKSSNSQTFSVAESRSKNKCVSKNLCRFFFFSFFFFPHKKQNKTGLTIVSAVYVSQTDDIKISNSDHALSIQPYPAHTACFPCQTTRGQRGWGNRDHWIAAITPALRILYFTPKQVGFLAHAIVIVVWLL